MLFINKMLFFAIVFIAYVKPAVCLPDDPVPHAEILDEILTKALGEAYTKNSIFDYILGASNETTDNRYINDTNDNLGIRILDADSVKKVVELAKKKYESELSASRKTPARRAYQQLHEPNPYVVSKTADFMHQMIYLARERINDTIPFRKKYQENYSYLIGILYGASAAIITKMEILVAQSKMVQEKTHFIWYIIIYEKMLACYIDVSNNIERIFLLHDDYTLVRGPKSNLPLRSKYDSKRQKTGTSLPPHIASILEQHRTPGS